MFFASNGSGASRRIRAGRRRGVVLVAVLGIIMILSWLTLEILDAVRRDLARTASPADELRLRQTAYQFLEVTMGILAEVRQFEGELYSPGQGWGTPLSYVGIRAQSLRAQAFPVPERNVDHPGEGEPLEDDPPSLLAELLADTGNSTGDSDAWERDFFAVESGFTEDTLLTEMTTIALPAGLEARIRVFDEGGKLPLTATTETRWLHFFEAMGFEPSEGLILRDSLLDWMDPDTVPRAHGAEAETYAQREPPYRVPNRPLRDFEELRLIQGFEDLFFDESGTPNARFRAFRSSVSLYHSGRVNLNTANRLVLETLAEEQGFEVDELLDFLAGPDLQPGTADDRLLRPGLNPEDLPRRADASPVKFDRAVDFVHVVVEITGGLRTFTLQAYLDLARPDPGGVYPFTVVRVLENAPVR